MIERRALLKAAVVGMAGAASGCATQMAGGGGRPYPLGMTDATLRAELAKDYAGTLRQVKAMGYTHMGFRLLSLSPADRSEPSAEVKAQMVRDAGMELGPVRFAISNRPTPFDPQIETAAKIGAKIVALTTAPIYIGNQGGVGVTTRAAMDAFIPEMDAIGAKCRAAGLIFAYHNHPYDFTPLDGDRPLDLMIARADPRNVAFEIDLAWAHYGGQDPIALLRRLGPRVVSMHVKDIDRTKGTDFTHQCVPPGEGEMDYARLLPQISKVTNALGLVEIDNPPDGLAAAARGSAFVRKYWKA